MNKFQMIALEMEKIGFRSLPKDVTVNGEFESMIRNDFSMVDGLEDFFSSNNIVIKEEHEYIDYVNYASEDCTSYEIIKNESLLCA